MCPTFIGHPFKNFSLQQQESNKVMTKKNLYSLIFAGMIGSSSAFADANLSAQHHFVSVANVPGGSEVVFDITIGNVGSDNLNTLVFSAADSLLSQNVSTPVFEMTDLGAGAQSTLRVTFHSPIESSYFNNGAILLLDVRAMNDMGQPVSMSMLSLGAPQ